MIPVIFTFVVVGAFLGCVVCQGILITIVSCIAYFLLDDWRNEYKEREDDL